MGKYIGIGYNEIYKNDSIEPYWVELINGDNRDEDEILSWHYTEEDVRKVGRNIANKMGIPFSDILMIG